MLVIHEKKISISSMMNRRNYYHGRPKHITGNQKTSLGLLMKNVTSIFNYLFQKFCGYLSYVYILRPL